jgi:hypothetical protein
MKHNAKLVLSYEVYRQIRWLTFNYDKEIGAMGIGKMKTNDEGDKYVYVEKLFFPKQQVTAATVHFTSDGYAELLKNKEFVDRMGDVCFYWHKHPGCSAHHSSTDDEDTFETYMAKEAGRKWFAFLQTAKKVDGTMDTECRIDIRNPVRVTILNTDIELRHELAPEQTEFNKAMTKLIDDVVIKYVPPVYTPPVHNNNTLPQSAGNNQYKSFNVNSNKSIDSRLTPVVVLNHDYNRIEDNKGGIYMDNDTLKGVATSIEEKASMDICDGCVKVKANELFTERMDYHLNNNNIKQIVKKVQKNLRENKMTEYIIQPEGGKYKELGDVFTKIYTQYNKDLLAQYEKAVTDAKNLEETKDEDFQMIRVNEISNSVMELSGGLCVSSVLADVSAIVDVTWITHNIGEAYASLVGEVPQMIGKIIYSEDFLSARIEGEKLIGLIYPLIDEVSEMQEYNDSFFRTQKD